MEAPKSTSKSGHMSQKLTRTMPSDSRSRKVPTVVNTRPAKAPPPGDCHNFRRPMAMSPAGQYRMYRSASPRPRLSSVNTTPTMMMNSPIRSCGVKRIPGSVASVCIISSPNSVRP
jgi:hypothetical protein